MEKDKKQLIKKDNEEEIQWASGRLEIIMGVALFLIIGEEVTSSGWLPSYAVMTGVMDKSEAAFCGTLFWLMSTSLRFSSSALKMSISAKLKVLLVLLVACSCASLTLYLTGNHYLNAILGSIGFGIACSAVFPLLMALPVEFGLKFKPEQISNLMLPPFLSSLFLTGMILSLIHI